MSQRPISLSPDLRRLREEGYFVQIRGGLLLLRDVPYVDENKIVRRGTLVSSLDLASDVAQPPKTHVVHFVGDHPSDANGQKLTKIVNQSGKFDLGDGIVASYSFSSKPAEGYKDYHHKMTTYASLLSGHAAVLEPGATPKTFTAPDEDEDSVFIFTETASGRAGIGALNKLLANENIKIVGLGGTGSYILDSVAKTHARQIHLIDGDEFLQHNAFRAPGAPTLDELRDAPKKVDYFKAIYSRMHRGIVAHPVKIGEDNLDLLNDATFVFICIDGGKAKRAIIRRLEDLNIPFVDVGMGLQLTDGALGGILRVTSSTAEKHEHVMKGRVPLDDREDEDLYATNIQIAELNAFNAALAVLKWKKIRGYYRDLEHEHHSTYTTDVNMMISDDLPE